MTSLTLSQWLTTRVPAPPPALAARLQVLSREGDDGESIPEALVVASREVLRRLLHDGQTAREGALELLAADALATYAFEAEGESPGDLDARCSWAMRYFSAIADPA
ncbi:MAG: hypothetical protein ABI910_07215 [Gemmatimonadota bacterium]